MKNKIEFIKKYADKDFYFITGICVLAIFKAINYCFPATSIFEKLIIPERIDKLIYDICVGLIVTYIFYFIVTFIPNFKDKIQKEKELIPLECMIYREVQYQICSILNLLKRIMSYKEVKSCNKIEDFLNYDDLVIALKNVKLSELSYSIDGDANYFKRLINKEYIYTKCKEIQIKSSKILQNHRNNLPSKLSYSIFYLVNECPLIFGYTHIYDINKKRCNENENENLYDNCLIYEDNLYKSIQQIINIYEWTQIKYNYLKENIDESSTIYPVDFRTYIPNVNLCKIDNIKK